MKDSKKKFHESAFVESFLVGEGTKIWHNSHVRKGSVIGSNCTIGKNVYIDQGVVIGNKVKIQNNVSVYSGVTIEDGVFIGPHVCFTNDLNPRSISTDGSLKDISDWHVTKTYVKYGASIGANSTILCGIIIGRFAMVGAGSVITKDVPDYGLVYGNPARLKGYMCRCGFKAKKSGNYISCEKCGLKFSIK